MSESDETFAAIAVAQREAHERGEHLDVCARGCTGADRALCPRPDGHAGAQPGQTCEACGSVQPWPY